MAAPSGPVYAAQHAAPQYSTQSDDIEKATPKVLVSEKAGETAESRETLPGNRFSCGAVAFDIIVAALPLYFVGFAIAAYARHGTLESSLLNQILIRMAKFVRILALYA
jgi:hypothetical protein